MRDNHEKYSILHFTQDCDIIDTMGVKHPESSLPSHNRGLKTIYFILTQGADAQAIEKADQLPFGLGHTDHIGVFSDIDCKETLKLTMEKPECRKGHQLSANNGKHQMTYIAEVKKTLEAHIVWERVRKLSSKSNKGMLPKDENNIKR